MNQDHPFEVFYDGDCPLCKREIDMIRRHDKQDRILLTDLAAADFEPANTDRSLDTLMREIHGRYADGTFVVGVEVFREIYQRIGWSRLVAPTRLPVVRWLMDCGYRFFAWFRYRSAVKRMARKGCLLRTDSGNGSGNTSTRVANPSESSSGCHS